MFKRVDNIIIIYHGLGIFTFLVSYVISVRFCKIIIEDMVKVLCLHNIIIIIM